MGKSGPERRTDHERGTRQEGTVKVSSGRVGILPSILSADFCILGQQIAEVDEAGADGIHVDVMDGRFVPNITIGPLMVEAARRSTRLPLDVHLMIVEPERYLEDFAKAGADTILVHQEACPHLHRTVQQIKSLGSKAGVVLNPATPLATLEDILPDLDQILIMSVNPGFGGQSFIESSVEKVRRLKRMLDERGLEHGHRDRRRRRSGQRRPGRGRGRHAAGSRLFGLQGAWGRRRRGPSPAGQRPLRSVKAAPNAPVPARRPHEEDVGAGFKLGRRSVLPAIWRL